MSTTPEVITRMQALIDAWESVEDRRAIFLSCYTLMTQNMFLAAEQGRFQDVAWVIRLLHRFADYYLEAVEAYDNQGDCSEVWCYAFNKGCKGDLHVVQNLILGVNAHINYDLVLALVDMLQEEWPDLSAEQRARRYRDHCQVNAIIAETINRVQDQIIERYSPRMNLVDVLFGPLDEWLIAQLIANWREEVWHHAGAMMACDDEDARCQLRQEIQQRTMTRAETIAGKRGIAGLLDLI